MKNLLWQKFSKPFWHEYAPLFGLYSLTVGYPFVALLGENPDFFFCHHVDFLRAFITVLGIALLVPAVLLLLRVALHWLTPRLRVFFDLPFALLICLPAGLYYAPRQLILKVAAGQTALVVYWVISVLAGTLLFALFCHRRTREFFRLAGILPLVFIGYFAFLAPSSKALLAKKPAPDQHSRPETPAPVVMVIMDEFSLSVILDRQSRIDSARFPNLAALASNAYWFPRARTVAAQTRNALPCILSGRALQLDRKSTFSNTLYSWLQSQGYRMNLRQWGYYVNDTSIEHFMLMPFLSDLSVLPCYFYFYSFIDYTLPQKVTLSWKNFANSTRNRPLSSWLNDLHGGKTLNVIHLNQPHPPLTSNYNGISYANSQDPVGSSTTMSNILSLTNLGYHQYVLQCANVDRALGQITDRLRKKQIYDSALFIVMADHGSCFAPGSYFRGGTSDIGITEAGSIPLFIKLPHQTTGKISDRLATSLDILPTICGVLRARLPWSMDGVDLFAAAFPISDYTRNNKRVFFNMIKDPAHKSGYREYSTELIARNFPLLLERNYLLFGEHTSWPDTPVNYTQDPRWTPLLRREVKDFTVADGPAVADIHLSNRIFLTGNLYQVSAEWSAAPLAVVVNDRIFAITQPAPWQKYKGFFGAMFPSSRVTPENLSFYLVRPAASQGGFILQRVSRINLLTRELLGDLASTNQI